MSKKRNFKKNKKNKKTNKKANNVSLDNTAEGFLEKVKYSNKYKNSIIYLETFDSNKDSWKFNKNTQYVLLKYILNKELYDKHYFRLFRKYMKSMSESTRKSYVEKCLKDVESLKENKLIIVENKNFRDEEIHTSIKNIWNKRALKIIEKFL